MTGIISNISQSLDKMGSEPPLGRTRNEREIDVGKERLIESSIMFIWMSKPLSEVLKNDRPLESLFFREYRRDDLQRCVEITANAWPELTTGMPLISVEWYQGSATWKEVACVSEDLVGVLFGRLDSDLPVLGGLRITLNHMAVYLKVLFGLYGKVPHRFTLMRHAMSDDRKVAANTPEGDGEISFFAVDAAYRGKGIGTGLMSRFIDHAKKKGARRVSVYTTNPGCDFEFYERYGFRKHSSFRDGFMSFARNEDVTALIFVLDLEK